jgi:hypothetical protein
MTQLEPIAFVTFQMHSTKPQPCSRNWQAFFVFPWHAAPMAGGLWLPRQPPPPPPCPLTTPHHTKQHPCANPFCLAFLATPVDSMCVGTCNHVPIGVSLLPSDLSPCTLCPISGRRVPTDVSPRHPTPPHPTPPSSRPPNTCLPLSPHTLPLSLLQLPLPACSACQFPYYLPLPRHM